MRGRSLRLFVCFLILLTALGALRQDIPKASADSGGTAVYTPTDPHESNAYGRIIRLAHSGSANGRLLATFEHWNGGTPGFLIEQSLDDGATWTQIGAVRDGETGAGHPWTTMWQPFLFEFPRQLGAYPAGTLLLVGNVLPSDTSVTHFQSWRSTDHGATWQYVNTFQTGGSVNGHSGIWEPFLMLDKAGRLVCYFSDERQGSTYSQFLGQIASTDGGVTWSGETQNTASSRQNDRPGMVTITQMPNGDYAEAFEVCIPYPCEVHVKTSTDGDTWGAGPTDLGNPVQTSNGVFANSSPYIVWVPDGSPNGQLLLDSHWANANPADYAPETYRTMFANTNKGVGPWQEIPTPWAPAPPSSGCFANYSPALLPSADGARVLMMAASSTPNNGPCEERVGSANPGVLPYGDPFATGRDAGWDTYGGCFAASGGVYSDGCPVLTGTQSITSAGNTSVAGNTGWTDYELRGDVRLDASGQAGLIVRVTAPSTASVNTGNANVFPMVSGPDGYDGYFVSISDSGSTIALDRSDGTVSTPLYSAPMASPVRAHAWYHIVVKAVGCTFTVTAQPSNGGTPTTFSSTDSTPLCHTNGMIGVRDTTNTAASWRNISARRRARPMRWATPAKGSRDLTVTKGGT